jgi:anti-anti-sigma factor
VATSLQLAKECRKCLETGIKTILIDLQNVDFIDSSGLGTLFSMHSKLRLAGGKLCLCSLKDQARSLFDISDMSCIFEIYSDREDFISHFGSKNLSMLAQ